MHRLYMLGAALAVLGVALMAHPGGVSAQQKKQAKPQPSPRIIIQRDRFFGPPPQPEPRYYGPAPGIQPPMERVPMPPPLAQPPINR